MWRHFDKPLLCINWRGRGKRPFQENRPAVGPPLPDAPRCMTAKASVPSSNRYPLYRTCDGAFENFRRVWRFLRNRVGRTAMPIRVNKEGDVLLPLNEIALQVPGERGYLRKWAIQSVILCHVMPYVGVLYYVIRLYTCPKRTSEMSMQKSRCRIYVPNSRAKCTYS